MRISVLVVMGNLQDSPAEGDPRIVQLDWSDQTITPDEGNHQWSKAVDAYYGEVRELKRLETRV